MTGRPPFALDQEAPVTADDMNLISGSSIQRFDTLAAARAAFAAPNTAPADGETIFAADQDPPLMCWRASAGVSGDFVPWEVIATEVDADASPGPVPTVAVSRQPPTTIRQSGIPTVPGIGVLPDQHAEEAAPNEPFDYYWLAATALPVGVSAGEDSNGLVAVDQTSGTVWHVKFDGAQCPARSLRPPQTTANTVVRMGGFADSANVAAVWHDGTNLRVITDTAGVRKLWTVAITENATATDNGAITGLDATVTAACVHRGRVVVATDRGAQDPVTHIVKSKLWYLDGNTATEWGELSWPSFDQGASGHDVQAPQSMASHRGVLYVFTPQRLPGDRPTIPLSDPLWRVIEWADRLDVEAVAPTDVEGRRAGIASVPSSDLGEPALFHIDEQATGLGQYRYAWNHGVAPWTL